MKKAILTVMCGLPGSGKSWYAENMSRSLDIPVVSSDELRRELLGDVNDQSKNNTVFQEAFTRIDNYLREGKEDVIFDATNINEKKRRALVGTFKPNCAEINLVFMNTSIGECIYRDGRRSRRVGQEVIGRMSRKFHFPTSFEGWSNIEIIDYLPFDERSKVLNTDFDKCLFSYDEMRRLLLALDMYTNEVPSKIIDFPQDTTHHTFSVSRHTWHVYKYLYENYSLDKELPGFDYRRKNILWAALLHDIGKPNCKEFVDNSRYASFIGHAEVSALMACSILKTIGLPDDQVKDICNIIGYHMLLLNGLSPNKLKDKYNIALLEDLIIFAEADQRAK